MDKPHYFHFATEGLKDDMLFCSVTEFIAGVNRIALCLIRLGPDHPVQVICFCLMDNHVHFILYGLEEDCILFMERYKLATELWLRHHGKENAPGKNPEDPRREARQSNQPSARIPLETKKCLRPMTV